MRFIDKSNADYSAKAHCIITDFVKAQWQADCGKYLNLNYESFSKEGLRNILLEEQQDYCCYCMRKLKTAHTTLEHVIPNRLESEEEYEQYTTYGLLNKQHVVFGKSIDPTKELSLPPYPHYIAYENLVVSCDGEIAEGQCTKKLHQCCNNRREDDFIYPLFFINDTPSSIIYEADGDITCDEKYVATIKQTLNLTHQTLRLIRKAWCALCTAYSIDEIRAAIQEEELRTEILFSEDSLTLEERITLSNSVYWNLLTEFSWFHHYFKNHRHPQG